MVELGPQIAYAILALAGAGVGSFTTAIVGRNLRASKERGKALLIGLNSNTRGARVDSVRLPTTSEGWQCPNGPYVKMEGDFTYFEQSKLRPLVVYNLDTGFPIRAKVGEGQEEMDGHVYAKAKASEVVQSINSSHGGLPFVALALIAGAVIVVVILGVLAIFKGVGG